MSEKFSFQLSNLYLNNADLQKGTLIDSTQNLKDRGFLIKDSLFLFEVVNDFVLKIFSEDTLWNLSLFDIEPDDENYLFKTNLELTNPITVMTKNIPVQFLSSGLARVKIISSLLKANFSSFETTTLITIYTINVVNNIASYLQSYKNKVAMNDIEIKRENKTIDILTVVKQVESDDIKESLQFKSNLSIDKLFLNTDDKLISNVYDFPIKIKNVNFQRIINNTFQQINYKDELNLKNLTNFPIFNSDSKNSKIIAENTLKNVEENNSKEDSLVDINKLILLNSRKNETEKQANVDIPFNIGNDSMLGDSFDNVLDGGAGNDTLDGGIGADTMIGGVGDDTYYVDNTGDVIVENSNEGTDTVNSLITYALVDNVENLALTGSADINGTGNELNNTITGNSGNNSLDGGIGADTMIGGVGDDTYYVDNVEDVITENLNEGIDTVNSFVTYTLVDNVENLTLTGSANINGTGNELNNTITGNIGNNSLNGGAGNDTLDGGIGADTMIGGVGDDIYYVDNTGDVIIENAAEGTDLVYSSVAYTLGINVENLILTGTSAVSVTGNELNNSIVGNTGNNLLVGGAGDDTLDGGGSFDTLLGGIGNDTYYINTYAATAYENADEGTDIVYSTVSYSLGANIENLTLTGTFNRTAIGNALDNILIGNTGYNVLQGLAGNDYLDGGAGDDTLTGGIGNDTLIGGYRNDTYNFSKGDDIDNITDVSGSDLIKFDSTVTTDEIAVFIDANGNLILDYGDLVNQDQICINNWSISTANQIETIQLYDGQYISNTDINQIIQDINTYAADNGITISSIADIKSNSDLMAIISSSWHS